MSERSERNPGITCPKNPKPAKRATDVALERLPKSIAPLRGAETFSNLIQGGATCGRLPLATICNRYAVG